MEEVDKKVLWYYIISDTGGLLDYDMSNMTGDEMIQLLEKLGQLSYDKLFTSFESLNNMFIERYGFNKEDF